MIAAIIFITIAFGPLVAGLVAEKRRQKPHPLTPSPFREGGRKRK